MSHLKEQGLLFFLLSMLTGLIGSFVYPLMSLFLVEGLNSPPAYIGLYTVSVTVSGLIFSQWLGQLADKGMSARKMFMFAVSGMGCALFIYANATTFWQVLAAGILLISMGNAAIPQVLTLARQWANQADVNIAEFNSGLRASISFAWIGGPPLGFAIAASVGFSGSFYIAAGAAVLAIVFAFYFIPEVKGSNNIGSVNKPKTTHYAFWLLGAAVMFGSLANIMYSSSLPLYAIRELGFAEQMPGIFMGVVAGLEIPVMLYAGRLAQRINKTKLIGVAFVCAMTFYLGIFFADQVWHFIVLQIINAIFYGVYAGLSLTLLQEELPERIGFTSAFYSNAMKIGMMLGTTGTGLIAQFYSFRYANLGSFVAVTLALFCLIAFYISKTKKPQSLPITDVASSCST